MAKWKTWSKIIENLEELEYLVEREQDSRVWTDDEKINLSNVCICIHTALQCAFYGLKYAAESIIGE